MPRSERGRSWRYVRALAAPVLLWVLVIVALREPLLIWLSGENSYDEAALQEWLEESRGFRDTLPEMVERYLAHSRRVAELVKQPTPADPEQASRLLNQQERARLT